MRVDAAAIVACDANAARLHALLEADGAQLRPLARGWFLADHRLRVSLVWRDRARQLSTVMTLTLRVGELPA